MTPAHADPIGEPNDQPRNNGKRGAGNKSPHWADRTVAVFTVLIFLTYITSNYFACQTLNEIKTGGKDTHDLAVAAKSQADAAKAMADAAKAQADSAAGQATSMKDLAGRALAQAKATNALAVESKMAVDIAAKSLSVQSRPWVAAVGEAIIAGIRPVDATTIELTVQFTLKNVGLQPALFVSHFGSIYASPPYPFHQSDFISGFNKEADSTCGWASGMTHPFYPITPVPPGPYFGLTMYPGDSFVEELAGRFKSTDSGFFPVGCIVYSDQLGNSHQTRFSFTRVAPVTVPAYVGEHLRAYAYGNRAN